MPPDEFVRWTTRSVLIRISAPSIAPTPVTSSSTPTLIGVPVGAAVAGLGEGTAAGDALGEAEAAGDATGDAAAALGLGAAGAAVGAATGGAEAGTGAAGDGLEHAAITQPSVATNKATRL